jgi:hypothetical protein
MTSKAREYSRTGSARDFGRSVCRRNASVSLKAATTVSTKAPEPKLLFGLLLAALGLPINGIPSIARAQIGRRSAN